MSKKIIIDARGLRFGTGRYHRMLLNNLQKVDSENQYTVLINPEDENAWSPLKKSENFERVTIPYRHYSFNEQLGFAWYLYKQRADLVHFLMPQQPMFYFRKHVTTIHDLIMIRFKNVKKSKAQFAIKQWVFTWFVKWIARTSKKIIVPTDYVKQDIVDYTGVSPDKITRTYEAGDTVTAKPKSVKELSGKKFMLYVGTAHVHKNVANNLVVFEKLKVDYPDLQLALAGKPSIHYDRIKLLADAMEDSKSTHFLGFVSDEELRWLFDNAAVYITSTLEEGFGLPAVEAMANGVPLAASNVQPLPEVLRDGAEFFDPHDPESGRVAVDKILSNKKHSSDLVKRARKVADSYSWTKMAQETKAVYDEVLS